ncbi:uncharacterized protein BJ171DRAFT_212018 [Polychytrium aggregatum]|uniref:uncharacterized protein n=1 Tax=Polychytrium aggregatum TaxID=110093 RepID=UPI0022FEFE13|nr:uncharacterized protein BJ171DRAFT_212018 [Polychytrium aggregatum]KAI9208683.1 hypothetical protein BJ171DRAFT_212018 [Polychytrium aggregatum]
MSASPTQFPPLDSLVPSLTFQQLQANAINACVFGGLTGSSLIVAYLSFWVAKERRWKPIYTLNLVQSLLYIIKIITATSYSVFLGLNCSPRAPLLSASLMGCWYVVYTILAIRLMLFTQYKRFCQAVFVIAIVVHCSLVTIGTVNRTSKIKTSYLCGDTYPSYYKQQYTVELLLELFTATMLIIGLISRAKGVFAGTQEIFRQLRNNEQLRIFYVVIFIVIKMAITWWPGIGLVFDTTALTHGIDTARSALVYWALAREQSQVSKTIKTNFVRNIKNVSNAPANAQNVSAHGSQAAPGSKSEGRGLDLELGTAPLKGGDDDKIQSKTKIQRSVLQSNDTLGGKD